MFLVAASEAAPDKDGRNGVEGSQRIVWVRASPLLSLPLPRIVLLLKPMYVPAYTFSAIIISCAKGLCNVDWLVVRGIESTNRGDDPSVKKIVA